MSTLLCVPILVHDEALALRDAQAARDAGAALVEFRIDDLFTGQRTRSASEGSSPNPDPSDSPETLTILRLIADSPLPCIVTCRPPAEGGTYDGPDDARISLFQRLGTAFGRLPGNQPEHPPRYIDLELSTWQRSANIQQKIKLAVDHPEQLRDLQTSLILSTHDFKGRPADLSRRILAMRGTPAHILKIAYLARSLRDNLELFDILADRDRPTIALAMGEPGLMSRILAPKFGGFLTFASLRPTTTTAPGQPTISDLLHTYRFRSINKDTAVYGVVGSPVAHSLSPHLHNAGFESLNLNAVYLPLPVAPGYEPFKASLLELIHYNPLSLRGLSITLPHKENLVRLAEDQNWHLDETSAAIGAANTVAIDRDSTGSPIQIRIFNTDAPALLSTLETALGPLSDKRIAILGAGGVAKSAAYILAQARGHITIFNRNPARADQLAQDLAPLRLSVSPSLSAMSSAPFDLYINCTPVGMKDGPDPDSSPIPITDIARLNPAAAIMDTIYNPLETPLLRAARESGLRPISGLPMFIAQAAAQFSAWTSQPAPAQLFDRIAREHLAAT